MLASVHDGKPLSQAKNFPETIRRIVSLLSENARKTEI
jgi:hypothetical protein